MEYPIATDFRTAVRYQMLAAAGELTAEGFYRLWFPGARPGDLEAAMMAVGRFYNMGEEPEEDTGRGPAYDFLTDGPVIFAAFQRHYGIDLSEKKMHWWQFRGLLEGLLTHSFRQRVGYRVGELQGLSAGERAQVLKYRNIYRIGGAEESLKDHLSRLDDIVKHQAGKEER